MALPSEVGSSPAADLARLTVTFSGSGSVQSVGSTAIACPRRCIASLQVGSVVSLKAVPASSTGFSGWSGACTGAARACTVAIEGSTAVAAKFGDSPQPMGWPLSVTVAGNGVVQSDVPGLISCPPVCTTGLSRGSVTLAAKTGSGSVFLGWRGDCAGTALCRIDFTAKHEVTATFRPTTVPGGSSQLRVTNPSPPLPGSIHGTRAEATILVGSSACPPAPTTQTSVTCTYTVANGKLVTLTAKMSNGRFAHWLGACQGDVGTCVVAVVGTTSLAAQFFNGSPLDTFPGLNVSRSGEGSVQSSPPGIICGPSTTCSAAFEKDQKVRLTATPSSRSAIAGWGGDASACKGTTCTAIAGSDRSVSVTFRLIRDELKVSKSGDGSGTVSSAPAGLACGATCTATFLRQQKVDLHATPGANSRFSGWSGACGGAGGCRVTMNGPAKVAARFDLIRDLVRVKKGGDGDGTVTSTPAGLSCGGTCQAPFARGSSAVLHAAPDASSRFVHWTGACSGSGDCHLAISGAKTVTARFERLRDELRVAKLGKGSGRVTSTPAGISCGTGCAAPFPRGTQVILAAAPQPGSTFAAWSGACSGAGPCTVTVSGPTLVNARFARICLARATTGFGVTVARKPRRVLVHVRLAGPVSARLRLFRGHTRVAQKVIAGLSKGDRQLRLDVPRAGKKGTYRVGVRISDVCGGAKAFSKQVTIPA